MLRRQRADAPAAEHVRREETSDRRSQVFFADDAGGDAVADI